METIPAQRIIYTILEFFQQMQTLLYLPIGVNSHVTSSQDNGTLLWTK